MAKISLDNGNSYVDVANLSDMQCERAARLAAQAGGPAYDEVDGSQVHETERSWLDAYCEAHERHIGTSAHRS